MTDEPVTPTDTEIPEAEYAALMLACPYLMHGGTCVTGCTSEPSCMTDAPAGGWESLIREPVTPARETPPAPRCEHRWRLAVFPPIYVTAPEGQPQSAQGMWYCERCRENEGFQWDY